MISSMVAPASRFSNTIETGMRVSLNTHAPLTLPGTLSTAAHCDQSRLAIVYAALLRVRQETRKNQRRLFRQWIIHAAA